MLGIYRPSEEEIMAQAPRPAETARCFRPGLSGGGPDYLT